jgi:hypothetical protein
MGMKKSELKQLKQLGIFCNFSVGPSVGKADPQVVGFAPFDAFLGSANDGRHPWTRGISEQPSPGPDLFRSRYMFHMADGTWIQH